MPESKEIVKGRILELGNVLSRLYRAGESSPFNPFFLRDSLVSEYEKRIVRLKYKYRRLKNK